MSNAEKIARLVDQYWPKIAQQLAMATGSRQEDLLLARAVEEIQAALEDWQFARDRSK